MGCEEQEGMKQVCIEKTIDLINSAIQKEYRVVALETKNAILSLKTELKDMVYIAVREAHDEVEKKHIKTEQKIEQKIEAMLKNSKDRFSFGIELIRIIITIILFLITLGVIKTVGG